MSRIGAILRAHGPAYRQRFGTRRLLIGGILLRGLM